VLDRHSSIQTGLDELILTVADDGRGLETGGRTSGFGLSGMRERVEMAGGTFLFESAAGQGFSFEAHLPAQGG
jgi:signal transduction histidine kinase